MIIISLAKRSLVCSVSAFCTIHSIAFCTIHSISAFCTIPILSTELKWNYVKKSVINFVLTSMLLYTVCFLTQLLKVDLWCSHFVSTLTQLLFLSPSYNPQPLSNSLRVSSDVWVSSKISRRTRKVCSVSVEFFFSVFSYLEVNISQ